jgi:hypothetical protein
MPGQTIITSPLLAAFMAACIDANVATNAPQPTPRASTTRIEGVALATGIAGRIADKTSRAITMAENALAIAPNIYDDQYLLLPLKYPLSSPNE